MVTFIVPRQLFEYGDTFRFSTATIEARGARLKRLVRTVVCWRPISCASRTFSWKDRAGKIRKRVDKYNSSPMEQLLKFVCAQEESWSSDDAFARPEKLRLQQLGCATRIKLEPISERASVTSTFEAAVEDRKRKRGGGRGGDSLISTPHWTAVSSGRRMMWHAHGRASHVIGRQYESS